MALVAEQRSTLNPNAPLFVPAVYRQVEDFSPEWWELVKTSTWFRDYWLSEHPEGSFDGDDHGEDYGDVADLLPECFDLDAEVEAEAEAEAMFDEMVTLTEADLEFSGVEKQPFNDINMLPIDLEVRGQEMDAKTFLENMITVAKSPKERGPKSPAVAPKYPMKPAYRVSPKCTPRRINQPR